MLGLGLGLCFNLDLTDKGDDSKLVHRRKRPKVDASIFDSSLGRVGKKEKKILASTYGRFRLYRLNLS